MSDLAKNVTRKAGKTGLAVGGLAGETPCAVGEITCRVGQVAMNTAGLGLLLVGDGFGYLGDCCRDARRAVEARKSRAYARLDAWAPPAPKEKGEGEAENAAPETPEPCPHCGRVLQRKAKEHAKKCSLALEALEAAAKKAVAGGADEKAAIQAAFREVENLPTNRETRKGLREAVKASIQAEGLEKAMNNGGGSVLDPAPA
jgi:ssDNA-binding Zn-finger/Zn-ribbon topoisomerase 1